MTFEVKSIYTTLLPTFYFYNLNVTSVRCHVAIHSLSFSISLHRNLNGRFILGLFVAFKTTLRTRMIVKRKRLLHRKKQEKERHSYCQLFQGYLVNSGEFINCREWTKRCKINLTPDKISKSNVLCRTDCRHYQSTVIYLYAFDGIYLITRTINMTAFLCGARYKSDFTKNCPLQVQ